jgi:hypothetical protein
MFVGFRRCQWRQAALGFASRYELDGFLKQHEVWLDYTWQDLEQDRETHRRLGL